MPTEARVCKDCGGKESDIIPFYKTTGNICTKCLSSRRSNKYAEEKGGKEKQKEIASQPVSIGNPKLPRSKSIEVVRYDAIHMSASQAKKESRKHVVNALEEHFKGEDKHALTRRDIENAVQYLASTEKDERVTNWYMVTIRVFKSDQAAFRWNALFQDWKRRIGGKQ